MTDSVTFKAISFKPVISSEFFKREMSMEIEVHDHDLRSGVISPSIVVMTDQDLDLWIDKFLSSKRNSIIVFLLGSETLNLQVLWKLFKFRSIKQIFVQYATEASLLNALRAMLNFIVEFPLCIFSRNFYKGMYRGAKRYLKRKVLNFFWKIDYLPVGYTDMFVKMAKSEGLIDKKDSESLLGEGEKKYISQKKFAISFQGYLSGPVRKIVIKAPLLNCPDSSYLRITEHWGTSSDNDSSYIENMSKSEMVISPPGYVSNLAFRHLESLIAGSLPVAPISSIQDWSKQCTINSLLPGKLKFRYMKTVQYVGNLSTLQKNQLRNSLLNIYKEEIKNVKNKLEEFQTK